MAKRVAENIARLRDTELGLAELTERKAGLGQRRAVRRGRIQGGKSKDFGRRRKNGLEKIFEENIENVLLHDNLSQPNVQNVHSITTQDIEGRTAFREEMCDTLRKALGARKMLSLAAEYEAVAAEEREMAAAAAAIKVDAETQTEIEAHAQFSTVQRSASRCSYPFLW